MDYIPGKIETLTSNKEMILDENKLCADKKSKKKCQQLKDKQNGKGCKKKSTKKNCKRTCGLCDDGKCLTLIRPGWGGGICPPQL